MNVARVGGMNISGGMQMMKSTAACNRREDGCRKDLDAACATGRLSANNRGAGADRSGHRTNKAIENVLAGAKLLIIEDEFLIGQELAYGLQRQGIDVIGPCTSVAGAFDVLRGTEDIGAAILDLNIHGHLAFDLADELSDKNIPFVFYTGYESVIMPDKFRKVARVRKPADWPEIRRALFGSVDDDHAGQRLVKRALSGAPDLSSILPALRHRARQITVGNEMAERLVERTLQRAIDEIAACPAGVPMQDWLIGLLESTGIGDRKHMN